LPTAVDASVEVVWAKDPSHANVTGVLLMPGTLQAVPCRWKPTVRLLSSVDGATSVVGVGDRRMVTADGRTYAVWDFNNVDISASLSGKAIDFWLDVNGVATHAMRWTYSLATPTPVPVATEDASDAVPTATPTPDPSWQHRPTVGCQ
jgi:hypothetical protein